MKLYHTGREEIREPDLRRGRRNADFGQGFYLTPDREFARRWAGPDAVVNEYELDTDGLRIHHFERSEDWFRYILDNRRAVDGLEADLVIGPIANDTIFETLGIIGSGFLTPAEALRLLRIGPEYTQAAVKTDKALGQLRWLRAERISGPDAAERRAEQDRYDAVFGELLRQILEEREKAE